MIGCCLQRWLYWLALVATPAIACAQTIQFGQTTPLPSNLGTPATVAPSTGTPPAFNPYGSSLGAPTFGTPATSAPPGAWPSTNLGASPGSTPYPSSVGAPWSPNAGTPTYTTPPPTTTYPGYSTPQSPGVLFPNGMTTSGSAIDPYVEPFRIFQHPRFSDTWLYGGNGDPRDVSVHDFEFAVTGALPNFFATTQPLYITPTFMLHLWDGPSHMPADLPANAYSAFVDVFWASDPNRPMGVEIGVAVGAFSDFETFNTYSVRVIGEGFGVVRLTPTLTAKLGVWYLNRNDLKLLPAGGLVWQPNPQTKFDILFPNPKYSQYWTTIGTTELWWYAAGEYGGGAWTIQRDDGTSDRVDLNDIRVKFGVDWINQRNWRGYFEIGYAFNRDVVYVVDPSDSFRAADALLIGAGFSF